MSIRIIMDDDNIQNEIETQINNEKQILVLIRKAQSYLQFVKIKYDGLYVE